MAETVPSEQWEAPSRPGGVESLVSQVLSALASKTHLSGQRVEAELLTAFCAALLRPGGNLKTPALEVLRGHGVSAAAVMDGYAPAAARVLGDRWAQDDLGFAEVTLAAARLQALLHDAGRLWSENGPVSPDAPNILIVVPVNEFHTLGGIAAASQFRRLGLSVSLCLGQDEEEILQKIGQRRFDMVAISASGATPVPVLCALVRSLRGACAAAVPVVIGGPILEQVRDARAVTGADFATSDPREAVRLCGMKAALHATQRESAR
ncbi:B12 binding protein [Rhodovulum imhoffii]|uniref:B12 binding protein n=1 Tax=Rhodovulum imhoffii TaxID=365340 RepID=A0A2T5BSH2_9RHOB|nr:cobalamin B12-binding domain-containing protein [Rhodovulum imhoffii]PTN02291.1 B12 binding protein [Rhodovulum imhoffii]